jgi:hypothetical protein
MIAHAAIIAKGRKRSDPGDTVVYASLIQMTVIEYSQRILAIWQAVQPQGRRCHNPIVDRRSRGTDQTTSPTRNPYVVAAFALDAMSDRSGGRGTRRPKNTAPQKRIVMTRAAPLTIARNVIALVRIVTNHRESWEHLGLVQGPAQADTRGSRVSESPGVLVSLAR